MNVDEVKEIKEFIKTVGPVANACGISTVELSTLCKYLITLSTAGISGARAGTILRKEMVKLMKEKEAKCT